MVDIKPDMTAAEHIARAEELVYQAETSLRIALAGDRIGDMAITDRNRPMVLEEALSSAASGQSMAHAHLNIAQAKMQLDSACDHGNFGNCYPCLTHAIAEATQR